MDLLNDQSFKFALENTVDAVLITDMDSIIQYINPAFSRITGYSPEDVLGKKPSVIKSRTPRWKPTRKCGQLLPAGLVARRDSEPEEIGELWHSFRPSHKYGTYRVIPLLISAFLGTSRK